MSKYYSAYEPDIKISSDLLKTIEWFKITFNSGVLKDDFDIKRAVEILLRNIRFDGDIAEDRIKKADTLIITYEPGLADLNKRFANTIEAARSNKANNEIIESLRGDYKCALSNWADTIKLFDFFGLDENGKPEINVVLDWFPYPQLNSGDSNTRNDFHKEAPNLETKLKAMIDLFLKDEKIIYNKKVLMVGERFVTRKSNKNIHIGLNNKHASRPYESTIYNVLKHIYSIYSFHEINYNDKIRISRFFPKKKRNDDHEVYKIKKFNCGNQKIELEIVRSV